MPFKRAPPPPPPTLPNVLLTPDLSSQTVLPDLSNLLQTVPAMVYTYQVNHSTGACCFPFVSNYCEEIFGISPAKIQNESDKFVDLIHPEDVNEFTESVLRSMKTMSMWDHIMRMKVQKDYIYIHGKSLPHRKEVLNDDGTFTLFTVWHGTLFDITDKYSPPEKNNSGSIDTVTFAKSEDSSESSFSHNCDHDHDHAPWFVISGEGIITHWNEEMVKLTNGIQERDILGLGLSSVVSDSNRDLLENFLSKAKIHLQSSDVEADACNNDNDEEKDYQSEKGTKVSHYSQDLTLSTRSGDEVHLITRCHVGGKKPLRVHCRCENITLLKVAEKEKVAALELLEAEKNLSEWLSHEIRNPLTIAMEAAKSLKETASSNHDHVDYVDIGTVGGRSYVDMIIQSISYVVDLLSNMLDINKLAAGKIALLPSQCSLMEDIIYPIQEMMSVKDSKVPILFSGDEMTIFIDNLRLKQVITNLLSNAIKFTKKGYIKVDSTVSNLAADGSEIPESLVISVSDTGPGVPKMYRKRLFSKWEQLGSTVNGTGIGLYLSRILVIAMKGEIFLSEEYDSGIEGSPGAQVRY